MTYNIGHDDDDRTKRMVEATARRMGFAMPNSTPPPTPKADQPGAAAAGSSGRGGTTKGGNDHA